MGYDKSFFDDDEEYPYSVSFENGKYTYLISVVWNDRDAELVIQNSGSHLIFDDDGSWAVYRCLLKKYFPAKINLAMMHSFFIWDYSINIRIVQGYTRKMRLILVMRNFVIVRVL